MLQRFLMYTASVLFLCTSLANAQEKQLTIDDAVIGQWTNLRPATLNLIQWIPATNDFSYIADNQLIKSGPEIVNPETIIDLSTLNVLLENKKINKVNWFPQVEWIETEKFALRHDNKWIVVNLTEEKVDRIVHLPAEAQNFDRNSHTNSFAYTIDNNLFFIDSNGNITQVTDEENPEIVYGQEVHRREFGINSGTFWSPEGDKLAFYRKDESMVSNYPLVDITTRIAKLQQEKYPMAGMKSHHVSLGIYHVSSGEILYVKTATPKEQYLTNIAWNPKGTAIYIALLNREQNHMKLNKYNAETGELIATLFEEKTDRYVEPLHPPLFINDSEDFLWQSRKDGYNHIYFFNSDDESLKQLTKGSFEVTRLIDVKDKMIYYESTEKSPLERHIYSLHMETGKKLCYTKNPGIHQAVISDDARYLIDQWSNTDTPKRVDLIATKNVEVVSTLLNAENPLAEYDMPEMEINTVKADDGKTELYYRLIKPTNFDPNKKYPAIIYVYGGPHAQLITNSWLGGARMWQYYMAQKGYVMLTLDNRGSSNRGMEFESIIHRQLGVKEIADQMKGVEVLDQVGYVDMDRIGVHGWSYGGFMTTSLMLKQPETFKVGVAGGPVIDWKYYEIMYGERYMDMPDENPEGYEKANLKNYVDQLEGDLLLIHGGVDPVVVWQHSLSFVRECVKKGKLLDYFVYPTHEHNVRGRDRVHLMRKVTKYFEDNL